MAQLAEPGQVFGDDLLPAKLESATTQTVTKRPVHHVSGFLCCRLNTGGDDRHQWGLVIDFRFRVCWPALGHFGSGRASWGGIGGSGDGIEGGIEAGLGLFDNL